MKIVRMLWPVICLMSSPLVLAQEAPYGSSKFATYADIESVKQLKAVWDFNFVDPKSVAVPQLMESITDAGYRATGFSQGQADTINRQPPVS